MHRSKKIVKDKRRMTREQKLKKGTWKWTGGKWIFVAGDFPIAPE